MLTLLLPDVPVRLPSQGDGACDGNLPTALSDSSIPADCRPGIARQIKNEVPLEHKAVDDVLGGAEAWKNADQTDGTRTPKGPHTHEALKLICACLGVRGSQLWQVHESACLLPAAADPVRRRAHDDVLQMHGVRSSMARGLRSSWYG